MTLAERLSQERRARLAAERMLELKQSELSAANRRLGQHAKMLVEQVERTRAETVRVRDDLSVATQKAEIAEQRLLSSVQALGSGFAIFDAGGRLVFANETYRKALDGLDEVTAGVLFARLVQIMTEEGLVNTGAETAAEWRARLIANFDAPQPKPVTIQLWNARHVKLTFKRVASGDIVNLAHDVTGAVRHAAEMDEARGRAEAANRAKSAFLANMSHEIRTPMNGVVGMAELLGDSGLSAEQQLYVDTIRNSAEALLVIINDVLDYSKIEADRLTLHSEAFDLERCIHEITVMLQSSARAKNVRLIVDYDMFLPTTFVGDPGRIRQVLTNIIGNAVKFTPSGHVVIRATGITHDNARSEVHLSVEDTGIGIAADMVGHVFGEFNQVEDTQNRQFEGTGLGLAICQRLVNLMQGEIWVESEQGVGSCFGISLTLPVSGPLPVRPPQLPPSLRRVMVVDDHPVNRRILERQLSILGADVISFDSAHAALAAGGPPADLVLTDHHMPQMTGLELAEALHARGDTVPIMLFSSDLAGAEHDPARNLVTVALQRPVPRDALFAQLRKLGADIPDTAAPQPPAGTEMAPPEATIGARAMRILTAEDNRTNRLVFEKMVAPLDVEVSYASDGIEAVEAAIQAQPDLIFMDISMPRMDGKEATAEIRRREEGTGRRVPIIALTAHAMSGDREEIMAAGLDAYLTKPLRREEIIHQITTHRPAEARDPMGPPMSFHHSAAPADAAAHQATAG